jgi:lysophospholipase L1-like esterase
LQVRVDPTLDVEVPMAGEPGLAVRSLPLPVDGAHAVTIRAKGEVALSGMVLERRGPGVTYDPLGQNGYAIQHLAKIDREHWIQALRLRRPDLVVLAFGTNEVGYYNIPGPAYAADYREVVRRIREALPAASILIMGPMDRGERKPDGGLGTMPNLIRIVEAQKKVAAELGVAFFDTYRAMGGEGAAVRGYNATPRLMTGDFTHPTRTGADRIAKSFVDALLLRHQAWKNPHTGTAGGESSGASPSK